ncbi:hypothetical protein GY45DRAFT_1332655 [Cubamyces sp. BRFM 1775]|nr:hypothetical protein GY45DRAFT_1332655 [Cubamyces sp. BRFM 1775]
MYRILIPLRSIWEDWQAPNYFFLLRTPQLFVMGIIDLLERTVQDAANGSTITGLSGMVLYGFVSRQLL